MANRSKVLLNGLFDSATVTEYSKPSATVKPFSFAQLSGSVTTGSFSLDGFGAGFQSTQQLPIEWSKFEKHTFFNSAESKVNIVFDTFINFFPFDSTIEEVHKYIDGLTGYEKYCFDSLWPKYKGWLHFSGTQKNETAANGYADALGTHINVIDQAGYLYPSLSKRNDAKPVINFDTSPFTCTFHINVPKQANNSSTILQKLTGDHGFSIFLSESASTDVADIVFAISSGSTAISASVAFEKSDDKFQHCSFIFSRKTNENPELFIYKDSVLVATSSQTANFGKLNFKTADLVIGSGSDHYLGTYKKLLEPFSTFSGSIDDLRLYASRKNVNQLDDIRSGSLNYKKDLLVFYRFNEPTGSYSNNNIVLDSSGNSLHATITNYTNSLRIKQDWQQPIPNEDVGLCPVLFPTHPKLVSLNTDLLVTASIYDKNNPNLITRLVPRHYLQDESAMLGYSDARGNIGNPYGYTTDFPGGGNVGSPQLIASLLFMWAKFFDEIKLFLDQFGNLLNIDYDENGTIADMMLPFLARHYGFELPNMFSGATVSQYLRGQNITTNPEATGAALAKIQAQIWRRILINIQDAIRSKGTVHGIKSIMRGAGIDPDVMFRFREFGGPIELAVKESRMKKKSDIRFAVMTSGSQLRSPYLSGSRIEVGVPNPVGAFVDKDKFAPHGMSDYVWDGLFTTGSWTVEFLVQHKEPSLITTMSLSRMCSTGSTGEIVLANCVGVGTNVKTSKTGSLSIFHRPISTAESALELILTGADVFDGNMWHISYGRNILTEKTSSYFLRAGRQNNGRIVNYHTISTTASFGTGSYYSSGSTQINASGSFLMFGSGSITELSAGLNATSVSSHAKVSDYSGSLARIRFWTKALSEDENQEHVRNFKSMGVEDPLLNFNFVTNRTGSFERMRADVHCEQMVTESNPAGEISMFDFSQNSLHFTGSGFYPSYDIFKRDDVIYSSLNSKFDERNADNKIRISGFLYDENIERFNALKSPVRTIPLGTPSNDDTRFSIELSTTKALDDDIILLLGTLDFINDALGAPELLFASDYPKLVDLREVYFNRLTDRMNYKNLLSFYKWIDGSIGFLIEKMIPSSTNFLGLNFVIESHILERNKMRYLQEDIYLGENDRRGLQTDLNLQQVVGRLKRY